MVSVYEVDANALIERVAEELKKSNLVQPPEWSQFVKTGVAKQRPPMSSDWWYMRAASVLRSVFKLGPIGVSKLRTKYGSKQNRGVAPEKFRIASGKILRVVLQQLEKEGYIAANKDNKHKGRVIAPKGQSLLEKCAASIAKGGKSEKPKAEKPKAPKAEKVEEKAPKEEKVEEPKAEVVEKNEAKVEE
jgi:small subunit ribosomal protein S19e